MAPTLSCNFACPYCYEDPKQGVMDQSTMDAVINLVNDAAKKGNDIHITWYGGEPLTAKKVIYSLSERIISICEKYSVSYNSYIVTNGYLINDEVIEHFKKYKIDGAQITMDGPPEIHNSRRRLKGSDKDTFFVILNNIKKLLENDINVSIRINVDKTNVANVEELLDILVAHNLQGLSINLGQVTAYTEACMSIAESCLNTEEYAKENVVQQAILFAKGFNVGNYPYYPGVKANYCCADAVDSYVLDPNGFMYKCWNDVGNKERAVGNVNTIHEPTNEKMFMRNADYLLWSPFNFDKCTNCDVLPICMGGCPYNGEMLGNEPDCEKWRYNLDDVLKLTYLQRRNDLHSVSEYVVAK
ncbi:radical SAM/SPASM domain-containing protein [Paenibacillus tianjinensis]